MLRDVTEADLSVFFEQQREPEANRMSGVPAREIGAFMTHWHTRVLGPASVGKKTIVVDGSVAGNVVSWEQDGKRLIGYWVGREYWGRGVATAALAEFLIHETTRPLWAYVAAHNFGSIRVLEKCRFRRETTGVSKDGMPEILMTLDAPAPA